MIALSYSRLSTFESCPRKFEHLYVLKNVVDAGSDATVYGTRVHEALELYGRDGTPLTPETAKYKGLVDSILSQPGDKHFEYQMALLEDKKPCDWFDKKVWLRGIADVLIVNGKTATVVDWKTGKVKDNPTQLKMFACMVMEHFPEVEVVKSAFVWLQYYDVTMTKFERYWLPQMWSGLTPRMDAVQDANNLGVFATRPSGLCPWCAAKDICPDARRKRK
jgi:hypothetical protein